MKKIFSKRTGVQSVLALILCMVLCMTTACGAQGVVSTETSTSETASGNGEGTMVDSLYDVDIFERSTAKIDPNEGARPETKEGTTSFRTMSFNIQMDLQKDENNVPSEAGLNRIEAVRQEILYYEPDFLGIQEDRDIWHNYLNLEGYKVIMDTGISGSVERCAIFYKEGIKLLKAGTMWLSDNGTANGTALTVADLLEEGGRYQMSEEHLAMLGITKDTTDDFLYAQQTTYVDKDGNTKTLDNSYYVYINGREMTYGVFDLNGQIVIYVNTHLQNRKQNAAYYNDALARLRNLERVKHFDKLQAVVDELKVQWPDALVHITGDFNDLPGTDIYNTACLDYGYQDAALVAPESYDFAGGSWNNAFSVDDQGDNYPSSKEGTESDNLDYCFVEPGITVEKCRIGDGKATITAIDGSEKTIYTSDHRPVIVDLSVKTETTCAVIDMAAENAAKADDPNAPSVYSGTPDTSWYTGDQTEYTLTTADQLMGISVLRDESAGEITFEGVTIKLGRDMVLNEGTLEEVMMRDAGNYAWKRLNSAYTFMGTFDGQGHTISGLYMNLSNHGKAAMFGAVGGNAVLKDFTLDNVVFSGSTESKDTMGVLASRISEDYTDVLFSGITVNAYLLESSAPMDYVGGLVGRVDEMLDIKLTIENCTFNGKIQFTEGTCIGGLIGRVYNRNAVVTINNCAVNADLTADDYCGGMVGYVGDNATVVTEGCTYNGTLTSNGQKGDTIGNPDEQ